MLEQNIYKQKEVVREEEKKKKEEVGEEVHCAYPRRWTRNDSVNIIMFKSLIFL